MAVRMQDVASAAGVSLKTVSRVVNDEPSVRPETRARVLQTIKALGFYPDPVARSLVTQRTRTIGIIVPDVANPFFARGVPGCVALAERWGYNVFLGSSDVDPEREVRHLRALLVQRVSGMIVWASLLNDARFMEAIETARQMCPVVFIDSPFDPATHQQLPHEAIWVEHEYAAQLATEHLLRQGRRRIARISPTLQLVWSVREQLTGYKQALLAENIHPDESWIREVPESTIREGARATAALLGEHPRPDGIVAYNDLIAIGALVACRSAGVRVPGDIAVVGIDDTEMAAVVQPSLTTIRLHQYAVAEHATARLLRLMHAGGKPALSSMPVTSVPRPELVVRYSTMERPTPQVHRDLSTLSDDALWEALDMGLPS